MRFNGYVNFKAYILKPFLYSHCISFDFRPCYLDACSFLCLPVTQSLSLCLQHVSKLLCKSQKLFFPVSLLHHTGEKAVPGCFFLSACVQCTATSTSADMHIHSFY